MRLKSAIAAGVFLVTAIAAYAHQGVTNPAVMARMEAMSGIGDATKVLGQMAKGTQPFDQAAARSAAATIAELAADTPNLFWAREDDKMSEALPAIWDDFDDFAKKSGVMETAAKKASTTNTDLASLRSALGEIGQTCKACHSDYRK